MTGQSKQKELLKSGMIKILTDYFFFGVRHNRPAVKL